MKYKAKLTHKVIAPFLALAIAFIALIYVTLNLFVDPAFAQLEQQQAAENYSRAYKAMQKAAEHLDFNNSEYANWSMTYRFVNGENPNFPEEDIGIDAFASNGITIAAIYDLKQQLLWGGFVPRDADPRELPDDLQLALSRQLAPFSTTAEIRRGGLVGTPYGLALMNMRRVYDSDGALPTNGYIVMGYLLDEEKLRQSAGDLSVDFTLTAIDQNIRTEQLRGKAVPLANSKFVSSVEKSMIGKATTAQAEFTPGTMNALSPDELEAVAGAGFSAHKHAVDDHIDQAFLASGADGEPIALLQVSTRRNITQIGAGTQQLVMLSASLAAIICCFFAWSVIRRTIVTPVSKLEYHIDRIRTSGDLNASIQLKQSDEIGGLAAQFNLLLTDLSKTQEDLTSARDSALQLSRTKSDFLATMSHEIRTPMNGVIGMAELMMNTRLDAQQRKYTENIECSATQLLHVINDILDYSKIESGKLSLECHSFNLRNLVEDVVDLLSVQAQEKSIELICALPTKFHEDVIGDSNRLRQVLINLIGNAIKFTAEGEVCISISTSSVSRPGAKTRYQIILFEISDTGIGISTGGQEKIFDKFTQEDASSARVYEGTGLGLSISSELIAMMDGEIQLESELDKGSRFYFTLKLEESAAETARKYQFHESLIGMRVLVVDDHPTNREILQAQTHAWGMRVDCAESGIQTLKVLRKASHNGLPYQLVLLDWHMPGMDGLEVARAIRGDTAIQAPSIIMLSSVDVGTGKEEARLAGIDQYLSKPIRQSELYNVIVEVISGDCDTGVATQRDHIAQKYNFNGTNVLLVEDNVVNQQVSSGMLKLINCNVTLAENGSIAVDMASETDFDIILMDCHLPVMDGFEATRQIRKDQQHQGKSVPIIAVTAHAVDGAQQECFAAGMDDFISKPFSLTELPQMLIKWLPEKATIGEKPVPEALESTTESKSAGEEMEIILDESMLNQIRLLQEDGEPNILHTIINFFLESSPAQLDTMREALANNDPETLFDAAHSLKSSSQNLGALSLSALAKEVELLGRKGNLEMVRHLLNDLEEMYQLSTAALKAELGQELVQYA